VTLPNKRFSSRLGDSDIVDICTIHMYSICVLCVLEYRMAFGACYHAQARKYLARQQRLRPLGVSTKAEGIAHHPPPSPEAGSSLLLSGALDERRPVIHVRPVLQAHWKAGESGCLGTYQRCQAFWNVTSRQDMFGETNRQSEPRTEMPWFYPQIMHGVRCLQVIPRPSCAESALDAGGLGEFLVTPLTSCVYVCTVVCGDACYCIVTLETSLSALNISPTPLSDASAHLMAV